MCWIICKVDFECAWSSQGKVGFNSFQYFFSFVCSPIYEYFEFLCPIWILFASLDVLVVITAYLEELRSIVVSHVEYASFLASLHKEI